MNLKTLTPIIINLCGILVIGNFGSVSAQSKKVSNQIKTVEGSKNLNGAGKADLVINNSDFSREKKITLLALLEKEIDGFGEGFTNKRDPGINSTINKSWQIKGLKVNFIFDGLNVDEFYTSHQLGHFGYLKDYLESVTTEDILGVEVMYPGKYGNLYANRFKSIEWKSSTFTTLSGNVTSASMPVRNVREIWIEITTRDHETSINKPTITSERFRRKP
jgi:hypothetical protein